MTNEEISKIEDIHAGKEVVIGINLMIDREINLYFDCFVDVLSFIYDFGILCSTKLHVNNDDFKDNKSQVIVKDPKNNRATVYNLLPSDKYFSDILKPNTL